jgi:hypothetical protein
MTKFYGAISYFCCSLAIAFFVLFTIAILPGRSLKADGPIPGGCTQVYECNTQHCTGSCDYVGPFETCPNRLCNGLSSCCMTQYEEPCTCVLDYQDEVLIRWWCICI